MYQQDGQNKRAGCCCRGGQWFRRRACRQSELRAQVTGHVGSLSPKCPSRNRRAIQPRRTGHTSQLPELVRSSDPMFPSWEGEAGVGGAFIWTTLSSTMNSLIPKRLSQQLIITFVFFLVDTEITKLSIKCGDVVT